jgi:hypothetical protein
MRCLCGTLCVRLPAFGVLRCKASPRTPHPPHRRPYPHPQIVRADGARSGGDDRAPVTGRRRRAGPPAGGPSRLGPGRSPLRHVEGFQRRLTTAIHNAPTLTALRDMMVQYQGCFNPVHANALMVRTAALVSRGHLGARDMLQLPALLPGLRDLVLAQLPHYTERCVANTLHSAAALDMRDRELLARLAEAAVVRAPEMTPQAVANVAWSFARLRLPPPPQLQTALFEASAGAMARFTPQELADVGWSAAVLRAAPPPEWTAAWLGAVARQLPHANGRAVARLLWTAARIEGAAPDDAWREAAWGAAARRLRGAAPHSVAAITWAVCRLWGPAGGPSSAQLGALLARTCETLANANAADVTVTLQALAGAGVALGDGPQRDAAAQLLRRAGRLLPAMGVRQASQLLWASARLRLRPGDALLHRGATKLFYGITAARAPDLAMGLWALARLGMAPPVAWASVIHAQVRGVGGGGGWVRPLGPPACHGDLA